MANKNSGSKMYLEIVEGIKALIQEEQIQIGEKLPSERELAERMEVGRSTIREALRSLELLGIIETRRGEGTFLADVENNQFIDVLSGFILQQPKTVHDIQETRRIHELSAIQTIVQNEALQKLPIWDQLLKKLKSNQFVRRQEIIETMIVSTGNQLSMKIWTLLTQYSKMPYDLNMLQTEKEVMENLLSALKVGDEVTAILHYLNWSDIVESERRGL